MEHGTWKVDIDICSMEFGGWSLEGGFGGWSLEGEVRNVKWEQFVKSNCSRGINS